MSKVDALYLRLLSGIVEQGYWYEDKSREVRCKQLTSLTIDFDIEHEFPLLTTKKLHTKSIVGELIWFLRGDNNIKYLVDNSINIWNKDAYNWHLKKYPETLINQENFPKQVSNLQDYFDEDYHDLGDVGRNYSIQWRDWTNIQSTKIGYIPSNIDQIKNLIEGLIENPMSRRHIVTAWNPAELDQTALPPCYTEETLINTSIGYKRISDIEKDDLVLTKEGDYQKVYNKMETFYEGTLIGLRTKGRTDIIKCTPNHEFFIKNKGWIQALFIEEDDFVGVPINKKEIIPTHFYNQKQNQFTSLRKNLKLDDKRLWWLMGYFIGDGWVSNNTNDINLAIADKEYSLVYNKIKDVIPSINKGTISGKSARYYFNSVMFASLFRKFGHKAKNKFIPDFILNAPNDFLMEFIEGYKMADGTKTVNHYQFGTISESLAYGIQLILAKLKIPSTVNKSKKEKYKFIENRKIKQSEFYYIVESYRKDSLDVIIEADILWYRIKDKFLFKDVKTKVYNISVENSNTYTAYNVINHNCHWSFEVLPRPAFDFEKELNPGLEYVFSLKWHQRSVDTFLGLPFNIASYAILSKIIQELTRYKALGLIGDLSNVHLYEPHIEKAQVQMKLNPNKYGSPTFKFSENALNLFNLYKDKSVTLDHVFNTLEIEDFIFENYESYPTIKAKMYEPTNNNTDIISDN